MKRMFNQSVTQAARKKKSEYFEGVEPMAFWLLEETRRS